MKRIIPVILLALTFVSPALAVDWYWPIPKDDLYIIHAYERDGGTYATHQGKKAEFSLDIQLKDLEQPAKKDFGHQCYSLGAPILAMRDGKILEIRKPTDPKILNDGYGWVVRVGYPDGSYTWYAHMLEKSIPDFKIGEEIKRGQFLGLLGATGFTKGLNCHWPNDFGIQEKNEAPHLHLETNTSAALAVLQEPMVGAERYTAIKKRDTAYQSTSVMLPNEHWPK
jgi:hypothetical protein